MTTNQLEELAKELQGEMNLERIRNKVQLYANVDHKRRLAECGGDARDIAEKIMAYPPHTGEKELHLRHIEKLLQLHTACAVKKATESLKHERNKAAMIERQKYLPKLEALQKQCEELLAGKEKVLATAAYQEHIGKELADLEKERDELRGYLERAGWGPCNIAACNCNGWHQIRPSRRELELEEEHKQERDDLRSATESMENTIRDLRTRAEKAEAEVAELKSKDPFDDKGRIAELNHKLTQLQQDVRPLLTPCHITSDMEAHNYLLETFLAKHPELKP